MPTNILPIKNLGHLEILLLRWLIAISKKALFLYCLLVFLWNHSFKQKAILFCKIHISMKSKWVYLYILVRFIEDCIQCLVPYLVWGVFKVGCVPETLYLCSFQRVGNGLRKQFYFKIYILKTPLSACYLTQFCGWNSEEFGIDLITFGGRTMSTILFVMSSCFFLPSTCLSSDFPLIISLPSPKSFIL